MTPETVHFLAQFIRHQRALMTSLERWAKSPGFSQKDVLDATWMIRGVLSRYETDLSRVDTTVGDQSMEVVGSQDGSTFPVPGSLDRSERRSLVKE